MSRRSNRWRRVRRLIRPEADANPCAGLTDAELVGRYERLAAVPPVPVPVVGPPADPAVLAAYRQYLKGLTDVELIREHQLAVGELVRQTLSGR